MHGKLHCHTNRGISNCNTGWYPPSPHSKLSRFNRLESRNGILNPFMFLWYYQQQYVVDLYQYSTAVIVVHKIPNSPKDCWCWWWHGDQARSQQQSVSFMFVYIVQNSSLLWCRHLVNLEQQESLIKKILNVIDRQTAENLLHLVAVTSSIYLAFF